MKKLLLILAAVGMIFTACEGGSPDDETNGNPTEQPGSGDNQGGNNGGEVSDSPLSTLTCAPNEILYTTKYGLPIELGNTQGFGGNLVIIHTKMALVVLSLAMMLLRYRTTHSMDATLWNI